MPKVSTLLEGKCSCVETIDPSASVLDAAELMNAKKIGSVVVVEGSDVRGILTWTMPNGDLGTGILPDNNVRWFQVYISDE